MHYRILGPFYVARDGVEVVVGGGKQRALLALLLLHANEAVSTDRLIEALWGESRSTSATKVLQNYISKLRRQLGDGVLITRGHAYELRVEPGELDVDRFDDLVADGRRALAVGDPEQASAVLTAALALWNGPPLADFAYERFAAADIERLDGLRLAALTGRIEADLRLGRHAEVIGELEALVAQYPLQERLRGQLMLALYRSGRQAEALQVYQATRRALVDELGIEPSEELQQLEHAILVHDPSLEPAPAVRSGAGRRRWRRRLPVLGLLPVAAIAAGILVMHGRGGTGSAAVPADAAVRVIDPSTDKLVGGVSFPVNSQPTRIAAGRGEVWALSSDTHGGTMSEIDPRSLTVADDASRECCPGCCQLDRIRWRPGMGGHVQRDPRCDGAVGWRYTDHVRAQRLRRSLGCRSDRRARSGWRASVSVRCSRSTGPHFAPSQGFTRPLFRLPSPRTAKMSGSLASTGRRSAAFCCASIRRTTRSPHRSCSRGFPATSRSATAESG